MLEFIKAYGILLGYFAICASGALIVRRLIRVPEEVFRKILHFILLGSLLVFIYAFKSWWMAAGAALVFMVTVYPLLALAEAIPGYSDLLTERKKGEVKSSLLVVFLMFSILISLCWGWLGDIYLVIASVLAWGLGDAAAALVGKRFGKRFITGKMVEGRKSLEGSLAMFLVSFVSVLLVLIARGSIKWHGYIPIAGLTAGVCALVELYTKGGMDTLTCPLAAAAVLIPLVRLWGV